MYVAEFLDCFEDGDSRVIYRHQDFGVQISTLQRISIEVRKPTRLELH
jgi:hypothetical protein